MNKEQITILAQQYGHKRAFALMMLYNFFDLFYLIVGWLFAIPTGIGLLLLSLASGMAFTKIEWNAAIQWSACWLVGMGVVFIYLFIREIIEHEWKSYLEEYPLRKQAEATE